MSKENILSLFLIIRKTHKIGALFTYLGNRSDGADQWHSQEFSMRGREVMGYN